MHKQTTVSTTVVTAVLLALTVCGSIWDYEIAEAVYRGQMPSENIFGVIFSYIGVIPTFVGWSFLGASIFYLSKKQIENTRKRRLLMAFAVLLFLLSFFYFCNTIYYSNTNTIEIHFAVAYLIGIAVIVIAAYVGYKLSAKSDDGKLLYKLLFLAAVSLVALLIISTAKELMSRPRFRFVLAMDNTDYFISWWQGGRSIRESLGADIVTDEFASFPSGHSAYSMFAIFLFPALGDYVRGLEKWKPHLFVLGFLWWAVTAFSRMTVGAHYLTDVTIAGLVTIISYVIVSFVKRIYLGRRA